jgi:hypothetical protein
MASYLSAYILSERVTGAFGVHDDTTTRRHDDFKKTRKRCAVVSS